MPPTQRPPAARPCEHRPSEMLRCPCLFRLSNLVSPAFRNAPDGTTTVHDARSMRLTSCTGSRPFLFPLSLSCLGCRGQRDLALSVYLGWLMWWAIFHC